MIKDTRASMSEFKAFSLLESIIDRISLKGYKQPTPIQKECIPALINGNDLLGIAQTGTGKTAAFSGIMREPLSQNEIVCFIMRLPILTFICRSVFLPLHFAAMDGVPWLCQITEIQRAVM